MYHMIRYVKAGLSYLVLFSVVQSFDLYYLGLLVQ